MPPREGLPDAMASAPLGKHHGVAADERAGVEIQPPAVIPIKSLGMRALTGSQLNLGVSNRLECQASLSASSAFQATFVRAIAFRIVSSFRMHAVSASFFGLPAASSRW